ncbi:ABC-F family ATP-binding cassette domain-containing protein [Beduini massiliensis]|uniref:ABC-F family ATP-binding cassette domain-containing protein n=1 Tax=Beduini massiliensis TaxID=1585974 RepID=UPI00059A8486|nr:ABC-F family ATP-binding cassette domain-containing protein [Beduini massiliensis]
MLLQCSNISKSFGTTAILKDITFKIENNEKIAIVGVNGAGKSTLMRIISNQESFDSGEIYKAKGTTIGYLTQESNLHLTETIYSEMIKVFEPIILMENRMRELESQMSQTQQLDTIMKEYDELTHRFSELDGYSYQSRIKGVLKGLGFTENDFNLNIQSLSGGQKTRVSLAKLLLLQPTLLLLDEPTNHLDTKAIMWLETYLKNYNHAVVIISHDRYFIDQVCTSILEVEHGKSKLFRGNYSFYVRTRTKDKEVEMKHYENQQRIIKKQEESIQLLRSYNREKSIKRAMSKEKQLEKMEKMDKPESDPETIRLRFHPQIQSGYNVLQLENLSYRYDQEWLFQNLSLDVKRGERIALIGPNGIGKTTLFKLILQQLSPSDGKITFGTHVETAYYDQEHTSLHPLKSIFNEIQDEYPKMNNTQVRNILASFQFKNDDVFKEIQMLSGGEKGRVVLAKLILTNANLLILDEPTNHLDIASKEILEEALLEFEGTVLFISHDRYFINKIATRIVEMTPKELINFPGNYDHYIEQISNQKVEVKKETNYFEHKAKQTIDRKKQNEIRKIEQTISKLEKKIQDLNDLLHLDEYVNDYVKYNELTAQIEEYETQLLEMMDQWEAASSN